MRVSEKIKENSERLDRQARLGIEPGTSRQLVLISLQLGYFCGGCGEGWI